MSQQNIYEVKVKVTRKGLSTFIFHPLTAAINTVQARAKVLAEFKQMSEAYGNMKVTAYKANLIYSYKQMSEAYGNMKVTAYKANRIYSSSK